MKVTEHIENAKGKTLFSFEIIPPQKGKSIQELYDNIDPLMEFKPSFIDVTYHREEYVYKKRDNKKIFDFFHLIPNRPCSLSRKNRQVLN